MEAKPIVSWAGGKTQLLPELIERLPKDITDYHEPFVGGGALFWHIFQNYNPMSAINDFNPELINLYLVVRQHPEKLMEELETHEFTKDYFYNIKNLDRDPLFNNMPIIKRASRFLYLTKTSFNALCRVNNNGQASVTWNQKKNPKLFNRRNILKCSEILKNVRISRYDFEAIRSQITEESFIYLDPPYIPLKKGAVIMKYTSSNFYDDSHIRLRNLCDYINKIGAKFMLSNSSACRVYELYKKYRIDDIPVNRQMCGDNKYRGTIKEVIIRNY